MLAEVLYSFVVRPLSVSFVIDGDDVETRSDPSTLEVVSTYSEVGANV
jgi:hypothetical protein